jgi:hypothetical protein
MNRHGEFKRRHLRKRVQMSTWMAFSVDEVPRINSTVDVAPEGAQFSDISPVAVRSVVLLRIHLGDKTSPLECKGRVCWTRQVSDDTWRFGVRFLDLSDEEHNLIEQRLYTLSAVA